MKEQDGIVILEQERVEVWCVVGKPKGSQKARVMLYTFGTPDSAETALSLVAQKAKTDPEFRRRFRGWQFAPARIDWFVEIDRDTDQVHTHFRSENRSPWS